jgi:hypothetical protein
MGDLTVQSRQHFIEELARRAGKVIYCPTQRADTYALAWIASSPAIPTTPGAISNATFRRDRYIE